MKRAIKTLVGVIILAVSFNVLRAEIAGTVDIHNRVGNGWHMYSTVTVYDTGEIRGKTTLKNYNNFRGFTGGLRVCAVDENGSPIYVSDLHQWGINAAGFRKKRERQVTWMETIPMEYLQKAASISLVQEHTPTNRVWKWVYEHRDEIIRNAINFIEIVVKIQNKQPITEEDIWNATNDVVSLLNEIESDSWFLDNIDGIYGISRQIVELAKKEKEGWVPENYDEAKELINAVILMTREKWDWQNLRDLEEIVRETLLLVSDKEGWIPENLEDVRLIVEDLYELTNDERMPDEVRDVLAQILEKMKG